MTKPQIHQIVLLADELNIAKRMEETRLATIASGSRPGRHRLRRQLWRLLLRRLLQRRVDNELSKRLLRGKLPPATMWSLTMTQRPKARTSSPLEGGASADSGGLPIHCEQEEYSVNRAFRCTTFLEALALRGRRRRKFWCVTSRAFCLQSNNRGTSKRAHPFVDAPFLILGGWTDDSG